MVAITVVGAALRLATLDHQSFSDFETYTVRWARTDLSELLSSVHRSEGSPPLYFVLGWGWGQVFGTGEVGLRSLSALLSTATIPLTYAAASTLVSRRAALVATALMAANPLAIWYAQEARPYSLLILFTGLTLLFFGRELRARTPTPWNLASWSLASVAALLTHYFAILVIVPEVLWMMARRRRRREVALACLPPVVTGIALIPLALDQRLIAGGGEPTLTALPVRISQVPKHFLVGFNIPAEVPLSVAAAGFVLVALLLLATRATATERKGARVAAGIALAGVGILIALAGVEADYVLTRYLTVMLIPCAITLAAGFVASRAGLLAAGALIGVFALAVVAVHIDPAAQRPDYRGALGRLGEPRGGRATVIATAGARAEVYLPGAKRMPAAGRPVEELVVIGLPVVGGDVYERPQLPGVELNHFRLVERTETESYVRLRYRSRRPRSVSPLAIRAVEPLGERATMLYQPSPERAA